MRHAKRYINGLRITLPPIKTEIYLYDFCVLEIIRIFYPKVYDDIWNNPWFYIPIDRLVDIGNYPSSPFPYSDKDDTKYTLIQEHINEILEKEKDCIVLKELLETIFFTEVKRAFSKQRSGYSSDVVDSHRAERRVTHPDSFKKYFMLKVPSSDISDEYIKTTLEIWNSNEKDKKERIIEEAVFDNQKNDRLEEFLNKILLFKEKFNHETATAIIRVIYKKAEYFSKGGAGFIEKSEYESALYSLMYLINDKIEKDKIQEMLEEVVTTSTYIRLSIDVVDCCNAGHGNHLFYIYDSKSFEKLKDIASSRLKKLFIDEKRDIFKELEECDWVFVLKLWSSNFMTYTGDNKKIVNTYILTLVKNSCRKLTKVIMSMRVRVKDKLGTNRIFDLKFYSKIYDLEEFRMLACKFQDDKSLTPEEREAIKLFIETPYETDEITIKKQNTKNENKD